MDPKYKRLKYACYTVNLSMSAIGNLSPVLFVPFHNIYGISYSLLGLLIVINFVTQLTIDLIFSFFSHKFNIGKTVKFTPIIAMAGLFVYALWPFAFPNNVYPGLVIGTIIFSAAGGLVEVLISPVIAAIPSDNPDRDMSALHSVYAWGCVAVIAISTIFLLVFGTANWQWLAIAFSLVPLTSFILFSTAEVPPIATPEKASGAVNLLKNRGVWACVLAIFLGGALECTMAQWSSAYLEQAMRLPKVYGDLFGAALFAVMLGTGRTLYSKYGKNIHNIILLGAVGACICYLTAAVTSIPVVGLLACALTGLCTSMLWPGNLIIASDRHPAGGVFIYAMMAAGGDLGASVAPQLVGIITDSVIASPFGTATAEALSLTPDQFGMKMGMMIGVLFALGAIVLYSSMRRTYKKSQDAKAA